MKSKLIKALLVVAQIFLFCGFVAFAFASRVELYIISAAPLALLVFLALKEKLNCVHCGTPLWDERTMGTWGPVRPSVVDKCGECGKPLFEEAR